MPFSSIFVKGDTTQRVCLPVKIDKMSKLGHFVQRFFLFFFLLFFFLEALVGYSESGSVVTASEAAYVYAPSSPLSATLAESWPSDLVEGGCLSSSF